MSTRSIGKKAVAAGVVVAGVVGLTAASTGVAVGRGPCICPAVYAPVTCPNGKVYPNMCRAGCAGQTGCVPGIVF